LLLTEANPAYATYYLSFITGVWIIDSVRCHHGHSSIQDFLCSRFGFATTLCYSFVIGIRLVSEVFANLLVIGVLFGLAVSGASVVISGHGAIPFTRKLVTGNNDIRYWHNTGVIGIPANDGKTLVCNSWVTPVNSGIGLVLSVFCCVMMPEK